ncbi:glycosyl hydrolase family 28-related protein [Novipirellula sp. SH528]|uniref:glycosyl hydrolase family 28-related protein n=1 Tax=Novipirellula sp. SH528 TaxID=3454466 RepID=UPI003FA11C9E
MTSKLISCFCWPLQVVACGGLFLLSLASANAAVNVRDFGAKGDAVADDTEAIRAAFAASPHVHFPAGVYVISDGIDLPRSARLTGDGSPALGAFPLRDDKEYFADGKRHQLPGTTLLFRGTANRSIQTLRRDRFKTLSYALKTQPQSSFSIQQLAIALDMIVIDANGKRTTPVLDQRSDCDVGLLIDDSFAGTVRDVQVFGHWGKAGMSIVSRGLGDNPDYNAFWNSSFMGDVGVALLGSDHEDGPGLSGTQFHGCRLFANDHHDRGSQYFGTAALYIDGRTAGKRADLNGHSFFGGCIRTYNNDAIVLDHASNLSFHGVVLELPTWKARDGSSSNKPGRIVGTENTRDVYLFGCRMHDIGLDALAAGMIDGAVIAIPDRFGAASLNRSGHTVRLFSTAKKGAVIQLTDEGDTTNSGRILSETGQNP